MEDVTVLLEARSGHTLLDPSSVEAKGPDSAPPASQRLPGFLYGSDSVYNESLRTDYFLSRAISPLVIRGK